MTTIPMRFGECRAVLVKWLLKWLQPLAVLIIEHRAGLARLEALENDNAGIETVEMNDDDDASLDGDDQAYMQKRSKGTKRKTRQAKAIENARKSPRTFLELLHEANLESLPPHVPSYLRAAMGPPSSTNLLLE